MELVNLTIKDFLDLEGFQPFRASCTNPYETEPFSFIHLFIKLFNKYAYNYLLIRLPSVYYVCYICFRSI